MTASRPTLETGALDGSEEPTVLGASPTLPGRRKDRRRSQKRSTDDPQGSPTGDGGPTDASAGLRAARSPVRGALIVLVAVLVFAMAPAVASAFKRTPADRLGVSYTGGPFSGTTFQRVVDPGAGYFFNGFFGHLYLYPAGVVTFTMPATSDDAGFFEAAAVVFPSSDHVPVTIEVAAHLRLNRDAIREFHEAVGLEHEAHTSDGWAAMEREVLRSALSGSIQAALRGHDAETLITDPNIIATLEADVAEGFAERLVEATGGRFFCGPAHEAGSVCGAPSVVIGSLELPAWAGPDGDRGGESGGGGG